MEREDGGAAFPRPELAAYAEKRPERTAKHRKVIAMAYAEHLPEPEKPIVFSEEDINALKAAFIKRFDEDLPRTETLMAVAMIGYRMALSARKEPE